MPRRAALALALLTLAVSVQAAESGRTISVFLSGGKSQPDWHGSSSFRTVSMEISRPWLRLHREGKAEIGFDVNYSDVRQPRSWFGHKYGDPDDKVRAENASLIVRRLWPTQRGPIPFVQIATGPMWSNRRIPAAASRLNFDSQLACGAILSNHPGVPIIVAYRFSHISNAGIVHRNPGLNVHSVLFGAKLHTRNRQ